MKSLRVEENQSATASSMRRRTVAGWVLAWLVLSVLQAVVLTAQENLFLPIALFSTFLHYGLLAVLAIPLWPLCRSLIRADRPIWVQLALHLVLLVLVVGVWQLGYQALLYATSGPEILAEYRSSSGLWLWLQSVFTYALVVIAIYAVQISRRLTMQRAREAELRLLMRESEIRVLRAQLRPHFLFNTLNSIYSSIRSEPEKAEAMVAGLADLMRETLELGDQELVPLAQELALAERYLEIEAVRLGKRLAFTLESEPGTEHLLVPPFLLQPLVENSIRHGIAPRASAATVLVSASRRDGHLELEVIDTGMGLPPDEIVAEGNGLRITRARLENLYGERGSMQLLAGEPQGCRVLLRLPIDPAEPERAARA